MSDRSQVLQPKATATLGSIPPEILQQIFYQSTTPTFFQLIQVNRRFFSLASQSREVILHHLREVPGYKLGLENRSIPTERLFLIFRQRAASHLYGINFTADCRSWGLSNRSGGTIDARASCLGVESEWANNVCLVLKNSLRIRLNWHNDLPGETIESPYADGHAKIIQVVQKSHYITVLYAWTPPEEDLADDTSHPEPTKVKVSVKEILEEHTARHRSTRYGRHRPSSSKQNKQSKASSSLTSVRYHLLHYDMFRNVRPIFFPIPTHKSINDNILVPVHLAVHNRLECAILWDVPDTMTPSLDATVCLYTADHLPRYEQGEYNVWVLYPHDRPTAVYRSRLGDRVDFARENSDDDIDGSGTLYTVTSVSEKFNRSGYDVGQDLRLVYFPLRPRAIAFFKEGRRLSLYAPGSSVPFTTLFANEAIRMFSPVPSLGNYPSNTSLSGLRRRVGRTNNTSINGSYFALGLPFFSTHETTSSYTDPVDGDIVMPNVECVCDMLCVGTARLPSTRWHKPYGVHLQTGPWVLTIVQIRKRVTYGLCAHAKFKDDLPPLPRPPRDYRRRRPSNILLYPSDGPHAGITAAPEIGDNDNDNDNDDDDSGDNFVDEDYEPEEDVVPDTDADDTDDDDTDADSLRGTRLRVAARLWGWTPQKTTLTGLDTISISPRGERIAVAQWDRVLVYALDPGALCYEAWEEESDFGDVFSEEGSSLESGSDNDDNDDQVAIEMSLAGEVAMGDQNDVPGDDNGNNHHEDGSQQSFAVPEPSPSVPNPAQAPSAPAFPNPAPSVASTASTSLSDSLFFYPHTRDGGPMDRIVELRPLVLKMDGGAVVRKMSWALGKPARAGEEWPYDGGEVYGEGGEAGEAAGGEGGMLKEKEKEDDTGNVAGNNTHDQPHPYGLPESYKPSLLIADSQSEPFPLHRYTGAELEEATTWFQGIPPAPFSDTRLIGQIKHIARPPDDHSSESEVVLESPEPRPPSPVEPDSAKGKENELMGPSTEGKRDEFHDTTAGQQYGRSPAPEQPESGESEPWYKRKNIPLRRIAENELVILTDKGLQVWDLSVWGRGRRIRCELPGDDILH